MPTIKLKGYTVEYFDGDIDLLPVERYQKFNQAVAVESGIGSDMQAIDKHVSRSTMYAHKGMLDEHDKQNEALRQCVWMVIKGINPRMSAFWFLVESINGKPFNDYSQENIDRWTARVSRAGLTQRIVNKLINAVKKKVAVELDKFFPELNANEGQIEVNTITAQRTRLILRGMIDGDAPDEIFKKIQGIDDHLLNFNQPANWSGEKSKEVELVTTYQNTMAILSERLGRDAKKLTVMEYYTNLSLLKKQAKANQKRA